MKKRFDLSRKLTLKKQTLATLGGNDLQTKPPVAPSTVDTCSRTCSGTCGCTI